MVMFMVRPDWSLRVTCMYAMSPPLPDEHRSACRPGMMAPPCPAHPRAPRWQQKGYSTGRGHVTSAGNMASDLHYSVGVTGFEPATSSSRTVIL
jgi:hypothetical protein